MGRVLQRYSLTITLTLANTRIAAPDDSGAAIVFQRGPLPRQLVVVIAVRAAVMAATMTFRISSQMFLFFMAFLVLSG